MAILDNIIKIKNATNVTDIWAGQQIFPGSYYIIKTTTDQSRWADDNKVLKSLALGELLLNDGTHDIVDLNSAINLLKGVSQKTNDGKAFVQNTPRKRGLTTYFTGSSDNQASSLFVGGNVIESAKLKGHHVVSGPVQSVGYVDFNCMMNETYLHEGYLQWSGALNDELTVEIVPKVTPFTTGSGTNFQTAGNQVLIVPAIGTGDLVIADGSWNLVQVTADEFGNPKGLGFWNADYDTSTGLFHNLTPAPFGNGAFNMFKVEYPLDRFINKVPVLGNGSQLLETADSVQLGHGMRVKVTANTIGADHEWWWNASLVMFRKKTV
jgi:hypothetical protein